VTVLQLTLVSSQWPNYQSVASTFYTLKHVKIFLMKHAERQSLCHQSVHSRTAERKYWNDFKHLSSASWGTLKCVTEAWSSLQVEERQFLHPLWLRVCTINVKSSSDKKHNYSTRSSFATVYEMHARHISHSPRIPPSSAVTQLMASSIGRYC